MTDLSRTFDREVEILGADDRYIDLVLDQKSEMGNRCEIGRYDMETGSYRPYNSLEGVRLYESFDSYGCHPDFFFAQTVFSDYRVRLKMIDKASLAVRGQFEIAAEGEIIAVYPITDRYLLVIDEEKATDELLEAFEDEDFDGSYYQVFYLYDLTDGIKYYLRDLTGHMKVESLVHLSGGRLLLRLKPFREGRRADHRVWLTTAEAVIAAAMAGQTLPEQAMTLGVSCDALVRMDREGFLLHIWSLDDASLIHTAYAVDGSLEAGTPMTESQVQESCIRETFRAHEGAVLLADALTDQVYLCTDDGNRVQIRRPGSEEILFDYDSMYGEAEALLDGTLLISRFYMTGQLRGEEIFKEACALHRPDTAAPEVREGTFTVKGGHVILLHSFLCL